MKEFQIISGNGRDLDTVQSLWEKLNRMHSELSSHFQDRFREMDWEERKLKLQKKAKEMLVEYVINNANRQVIGYCISSIDKEDDKTGEIDSIYIEASYRKSGFGKQLMGNALKWLNEKGAKTQRILVAAGNESVLEYYRQFGFYPLLIVLQKK